MATAKVIPTNKPDVELVLTWEEAEKLVKVLGAMAGQASLDTYDVYCAISEALDYA